MKDLVVGKIEQLTAAAPAPPVDVFTTIMPTGSTAFVLEVATLKGRIAELEKALRGMALMYGYCWDRVDGSLICFPENIERFENAHAEARKVLDL